MNPLKEARMEMALTKHTMKHAQQHLTSQLVATDLRMVLEEIKTPALRTLALHLLNVLERRRANEIDASDASLEAKVNQQLLKLIAMDMLKRDA